MPDPFEILKSYAEAATPAATPQDYYRAGAAQVTGAGQDVEDERTRDMRTMNPFDLIMKYGPEGVRMNSGIAAGAQDYMIDRDRVRSGWEATNDTVVDVARGVVNGVGGIVALGGSVVDPEVGAYISNSLKDFNTFSDNEQSEGLNTRREAAGVVRELNASDSRRQYERDVEAGESGTIARFREIGRNVLNEGAAAIADPVQFGSGVSQGVGSLLAGGLIAKGVTAASGALGATGRAASIIEKAAMPASIGALEGGGAYTGTVNEVLGMSHTDLMENSDAYRQMIVEGMSERDARIAVANQSGQIAAAIQAPIGVATGALVSKFERAPLSVGSLRSAGGNVVRETSEESIQSGSGQAAQNFGIQQRADETRELTQNVGESIAEGGLYGMGTAGVLQAPGAGLRATVETGKLGIRAAVYGASRVAGAFDRRVDGQISDIEAQSPVSAEAMSTAQEEAAAQAPVVQEAVKAALQEANLPEADVAPTNEYVDRLMSAAQFDPAEIEGQAPIIAGALEGATNRFDALRRVAAVAADTSVPGMSRITAGLYLVNQLRSYDSLLGSQLRETLDNTLADHPAMDDLRSFEAVVATIQSHPEIRTAILSALDVEAQIQAEQVSDEVIETPEGTQAAKAVADLAEAAVTQLDDPKLKDLDLLDKVDPLINDQVLKHAYLGKLILTPSQVQALELTATMARERQKAKEQAELWGLSKVQYVSNQIRSDRDNEEMPSAVKHTMTVLRALRAGKQTEAAEHARNFLDFAQSMQNKLAAINAALANGNTSKKNPSKYMALDPSTGEFFEADGVWVDPKNPATIKFAQEVSLDAQTVVVLANNLNRSAKLGLPEVEMVQLDPMLQEMADTITKRARKEKTTPQQRAQARAAELDAQQAEKPAAEPQAEPVQTTAEVQNEEAEPAKETVSGDQPESVDEPVVVKEDIQPDTVEVVAEAEPAQEPDTKPAEPDQQGVVPNTDQPVFEQEAETVVSRLDGLATVRGDNWMKKAFKEPKEARTRLTGVDNPVQAVTAALRNDTALSTFVGGKISHDYTNALSKAYTGFLGLADKVGQTVRDRVSVELRKPIGKGGELVGKIIMDETTKGSSSLTDAAGAPNRWVRGKIFNLLNVVDNKLVLNDALLEAAVLAGLQWSLSGNTRSRELTDEEIGEIVGMDPALVSDAERGFFNNGMSANDAIIALSSMITRFWGLEANRDTPKGYTDGIPQAVAADIMYGLQEAGLIIIDEATIENANAGQLDAEGNVIPPVKTFNRIQFAEFEGREQLDEFPNAIETAVLLEPEQVNFIGTPPTSVARTQMRNKLVENTPQQLKMIEKAQNTAYQPDTQMVDLYTALGKEGALYLFGAGNLDEKVLNKNHRRSLEGKNRTIAAAYDRIQAVMKEVTNLANVEGKEPGDMEIFYEHNVSRVGRLHMEGLHNPQANKLTREAFLPTWATLNLNQRANKDLFYLAIGQAWGVKVHKQSISQTRKDVQKLMGKPEVAAALKLLREWLEGGFELGSDDYAVLRGLPEISPHSLHAAVELSKFMMAGENQRANFRTSLYIEADGVTDGPINALVHMAPGQFTPKWLKAVGKGGLFFGQAGMTMNAYPDKVDLYGSTQSSLNRQLEMQRELFSTGDLKIQSDALFRVMEHLLGSRAVSFDETTGEITIDRGQVKNPLTVTIYGSGKGGIAAKVTEALLDAFYAEQSKLAELTTKMTAEEAALSIFGPKATDYAAQARKLYEQYVEDLRVLTNIVIVQGKDGLTVEDRSSSTKKWDNDFAEFSFSPDQLANLKNNVEQIFIDPLSNAIKDVIGEIDETTVSMRRAIQAQSIMLKHAFRREIERRLQKKKETDPDYRQGDFLSERELDEAYASLKHLSPLIHTENQSFLIGSSERTNMPGAVWARAVDGTLSSEVSIYGPTNAGVSGIPVMIIGPGDGQMIQNGSVDPEMPDEKMFVFDGVNFSLSAVEKGSELMNKAVRNGWTANPLGDVSKAFNAFMKDASFEKMSDAQIREMAGALFSRKETKKMFDANGKALPGMNERIQAEMEYLANGLLELSEETQARAEVLAEVQVTVDHMASAAQAYVSEGTVLDGMEEDDLLEYLNGRFNEKLGNIRQQAAPSEDIRDELSSVGYVHEGSKARVINTDQILGLVNRLNIPADQKSMMIPTLKALRDKGYQVVLGSPEEASNYAVQNNLRRIADGQSVEQQVQGFIVFGDKTIYLHNPSSETLLHELIHAATLEKVAAAYVQPEALSTQEREAVERIEGLMQEWLASEDDLVELNAEVRKSYARAKRAVEGHLHRFGGLAAMNKANAVNEFMAWSLSNQDLIRTQQRTEVKNPVLRVLGAALKTLKELVWGKDKAPKVDSSVYSNLKFNTAILLTSTKPVHAELSDTVLYQSDAFGNDDRLTALRAMMDRKIASKVNEIADPAEQDTAMQKNVSEAVEKAANVTASFQGHGFPMSMQEASTFQAMVAVFMAEVELNPVTLNNLQKIYTHVMDQLSVESFMKDPEGTDPQDRFQAQEKFNSLNGDFGLEYDTQGRSSLLPAFLALANTNNTFRAVLADIDMPKTGLEKWNTVDGVLTNIGRLSMDRLADTMAGAKRDTPKVAAAIDALTIVLAKSAEDQKSFVVQQGLYRVSGAVNAANDYVVKQVQDFSSKAIDVLTDVEAQSDKKLVKDVAAVTKVLVSVVNKERSDDVAAGLMSLLNQGRVWKPLHDLVNEFVGSTTENWSITSMVKGVKTVVQQARQQFREQLPEIIANKFSRELTDGEWTDLFTALGRTDLASLKAGFSMQEILKILSNNSQLLSDIGRLEGRIQGADQKRWPLIEKKARQLAAFMVQGKVSGNLLRNAYAVASLLGEAGQVKDPDPQLVADIDQLVSLYALELTPQSTREAVSNLVQDEAEGMDFTLSYLVGQRLDEQAKVNTPEAKANHYKGYIPSDNAQGVAMIVADDTEFTSLRLRGFHRVADYAGSVAEGIRRKHGYYFAPVSGLATYNQGIVQNVRPTASGVDPVTGFTYGTVMTAGRITDPIQVKKITARRLLNEKATEPLMPIYGINGEVVAYERSIDTNQEGRLQKNTHLGEMIGAWRGRQAEEAMAGAFNRVLIDRLKAMYEADKKAGRIEKEYVDLFDTKSLDPVLAEAVFLMTRETRAYVKEVFGGKKFMVRKDMLNDVVGYRAASIGDMWTGNTRISEESQRAVRRAAIAVFGADAYQRMVGAEKFHQNVISAARILIVVKSVVVPVSNLISNIYQLTARGVPLIDTLKKLPSKTAEVDQYVKNRLRQISLEADLRAATNDVVKTRKLNTELTAINDANRRMSIWPLIEAGEFSSISEGGITHDELALTEGRLTDYIEGLTEKLPEALKTAGKYALITKDTALFKGLARTIEYGDFLAKAVLYDDLTKRQKLSHDEALRGIAEEFINYDRLPGRARGYLESMGILWFWNFKIRATKVAVSMVRNNPLQTLLAVTMPTPPVFGTVGLPVTDNIWSVGVDGRLDNSIGLGQAFRAPFLNPWVQMVT